MRGSRGRWRKNGEKRVTEKKKTEKGKVSGSEMPENLTTLEAEHLSRVT